MGALVSRGSDFVVEYLDRSFGGGRREVLRVSGEDGSVVAGSLRIDPLTGAVTFSGGGAFGGEWTYITRGADGTKPEHITGYNGAGALAGADPADINVIADNELFLTAYIKAHLTSTSGDVELYATKGVKLGSNGGAGCKLKLNGTSGRPKWALGSQYATPAGTDSQKITAIIAILNDMGLFDAPPP